MTLLQRLRDQAQKYRAPILDEAADAIEQYAEERVYDRAQIEQLKSKCACLRDYVDELEAKLGRRGKR